MIIESLRGAVVCVVGSGYAGLPLAKAFSRSLRVISFDIDTARITQLSKSNKNPNHSYSSDPKEILKADFIAICVPTPVTKSKQPDLSYVKKASTIVGQNLKRGAVVILESTVYPGVTEEIVGPILEQRSHLKCGKDFKLAYSPERINPGDEQHTVDTVAKIVAGTNKETTELVAQLYEKVTPNVFKTKDIRTAEAAKLIENIQRDLNIALMNELSIIFERMGLDTQDVLDAAATKWNFHRYHPGLVGGYCIPVVPYYLVHKAEELGYHPQVILAGRAINDSMANHVVEMAVKSLNNVGKVIKGSKVLIMGCTYKENVADARETPIRVVIKELQEYSVEVLGYDPLLGNGQTEFGIQFIKRIEEASSIDCIILTIAHDAFKMISLDKLKSVMNAFPIIIDIPALYRNKKEREGWVYRSL